MTTVRQLFAEEIFLKGEPIGGGSGLGTTADITNIENNILTINALIAGLTGGQPASHNPNLVFKPGRPRNRMT